MVAYTRPLHKICEILFKVKLILLISFQNGLQPGKGIHGPLNTYAIKDLMEFLYSLRIILHLILFVLNYFSLSFQFFMKCNRFFRPLFTFYFCMFMNCLLGYIII